MNEPRAASLKIGRAFPVEQRSSNFHLNLPLMQPRLGLVGACDASHSPLV